MLYWALQDRFIKKNKLSCHPWTRCRSCDDSSWCTAFRVRVLYVWLMSRSWCSEPLEVRWGESDEQAVCLWHRSGRSLLELSGDGKPSIICGVEAGAVLRIRHKSLTEQIIAAAQCPWEKRRWWWGTYRITWATLSQKHQGSISSCSQITWTNFTTSGEKVFGAFFYLFWFFLDLILDFSFRQWFIYINTDSTTNVKSDSLGFVCKR